MKFDDDEKRLLKVPYSPTIQIIVLICNIIFQPIFFYIFWDIFSKDEISIFSLIFFLIASLFFLGIQYLFYQIEYVITNKRAILDDGVHPACSLKLDDLKRIKIESMDKLGGSSSSSIEFIGSKGRVKWTWVKYSESLRQQLENITSTKVES
jgi:hypothetical protein